MANELSFQEWAVEQLVTHKKEIQKEKKIAGSVEIVFDTFARSSYREAPKKYLGTYEGAVYRAYRRRLRVALKDSDHEFNDVDQKTMRLLQEMSSEEQKTHEMTLLAGPKAAIEKLAQKKFRWLKANGFLPKNKTNNEILEAIKQDLLEKLKVS